MLRRLFASAAMAACSIVLLSALPHARHNKLLKAEPRIDGTVSTSPAQVRLWFKEPAEVGVSGIKLTGRDSSAVALGPVSATDDKTSIVARITTPLAPGRYTVAWKTASKDGHVIRGTFAFTFKP